MRRGYSPRRGSLAASQGWGPVWGCQASGCTRALSGLIGFVNRQLSGGVRFEAVVRNGRSAADRPTERACVQSLLGAVECRQPIAELSRDGVVCPLADQGLRRPATQRRQEQEGSHPLPQALRGPRD